MSEPYGQSGRVLAAVILGALLVGSLVWVGATAAEPLESQYPDETEVTPEPEAYVGEQVVLGGFVVDTDPVMIATRASGYGQFTLVDVDDRLQNAEGPLEPDDRVSAFGTLEDESTLVVERATTRQSSETAYMYLVSAIGGLWVVGRFVRGWRFDRRRLAFVPRRRRDADRNRPVAPSERSPTADHSSANPDSRRDDTEHDQRAHTNGGE
ncbi:hypothetical protein [Natronorubrum sulfidifaciens]|uniref:OB-fold tRNA/helicase-type nucleic acid binding protein n=1 Tax=Natronorubrum sulfidifaciens JCM 14089 TaxID=1230460 RepID=L9W2C2_9EURY|nr:hypothetical protein [Natronorubrum sulfidifaciens]ELY43644.1 hypothetical protein C495_12569 [Natronorubrum sulfidifaciens JCM 14089]